jgi:hypothetical protein
MQHWTRPRVRLSVKERRIKGINITKSHRKIRGSEAEGSAVGNVLQKKPELAKANSGNSGLLYRDGNLNRLIRSSMAGLFVGTYGLSAEATGLGKLSRLRVVTAGTAQFASMNFRIET